MMMNDVGATLGTISEDNHENVMYRKKFSRLVAKARKQKIQEKKGRVPEGLMFDERKDITIEKTIDGNKNQFDQVKRENCTVVIFPGRKKRQDMDRLINPCQLHYN